MAYSKSVKDKCLRLYLTGQTIEEISRNHRISPDTLHRWKKDDGWDENENIEPDVRNTKMQIKRILNLSPDKISDSQTKKLEQLSKVLKNLEHVATREANAKTKRKGGRKQKLPELDIQYIGSLEDKFLDKCYPYQREFWMSESYFNILNKSRQTGFSYTAGGFMAIRAFKKKRDVICFSASQQQAFIVKRYFEQWAQDLGIEWQPDGKNSVLLPHGGHRLHFLPSNQYTIQGYQGDLIGDEFAWHRNNRAIYNAVMPSITVGDKAVWLFSTPYIAYDMFGEIYLSDEKDYPFRKFKVDIHRAIADGHNVDLEKIRSMFDEETFQMLYECKFFTDESSLLSIAEVKDAIEDESILKYVDSWVNAGTDIGRTHDLTATILTQRDIEKMIYVRHMLKMEKTDWTTQENILKQLPEMWKIRNWAIDRTGMGDMISERLQAIYPSKVERIWFTRENKEQMALGLLKQFQDRKIRIPNDRELIVHLHSIKKTPGDKGFKYDSDRNEKIKHADWFWSLALAAKQYSAKSRILSADGVNFL